MVTIVVSLAPIVPGILHKVGIMESLPAILDFSYNVGWFFGLFTIVALYWILSRRWGFVS